MALFEEKDTLNSIFDEIGKRYDIVLCSFPFALLSLYVASLFC